MTCPVCLLQGRLSRRRAVARAVDQVHPDAHFESKSEGGGGDLGTIFVVRSLTRHSDNRFVLCFLALRMRVCISLRFLQHILLQNIQGLFFCETIFFTGCIRP